MCAFRFPDVDLSPRSLAAGERERARVLPFAHNVFDAAPPFEPLPAARTAVVPSTLSVTPLRSVTDKFYGVNEDVFLEEVEADEQQSDSEDTDDEPTDDMTAAVEIYGDRYWIPKVGSFFI